MIGQNLSTFFMNADIKVTCWRDKSNLGHRGTGVQGTYRPNPFQLNVVSDKNGKERIVTHISQGPDK